MFKRFSIERYWSRILLTLILTCTVGVQSANNQTRKPPLTKASSEPSPQASPIASINPFIIATPQVAAEAMQINQRLRSLPDRLVSSEALTKLEQQIRKLEEATRARASQTEQAIQSGAIFAELQQASLDWDASQKEVESLSETLTKHATGLESELQSLRRDESRWLATNEAANVQESPPEVLELTGKAVTDIRTAMKSVEELRGRIVALQQSVTAQSSLISTEIDHLKKAKEESQQSLLRRDSLPLWKVQFGSQAQDSLGRLLRSTYPEDVTRLKAFITAKSTSLLIVILITLVALGIFTYLARAPRAASESNVDRRDSILNRPISLALLVFLVAMLPLLYEAPNSAIGLVNLIGMIPVVRLLKPRLANSFHKMLVGLIVSVLLWHAIKFIQLPIWVTRDLFALFMLGVTAFFLWLSREARRSNLNYRLGPTVTLIAIYVGIFLLLIAFLGNSFGYVGLSDLLTQATLASAYRAVVLYTVVVVGTLFLSLVLKAKTQQLAVQTDREVLARRLTLALCVGMLLIWVHSTVGLFAIREDVYSAIRAALNYQITIGSASVAVSNVVAFLLTFVIGYLVALVTRAILGEVILPRLKLAYGLPNAIATVTHYVLLLLIFLLALAAAWVELSKFTILTGALGVGLGFGLQNIVNNFLSGLILLFGRPVRVGDLLEVKGVGGEVTKIGVRSSTVHAFDGSDLIIPNATLISEQVTNWTLTGTRRQVFLNIHVAYGNDPTKVRDLLRTTAAAHPDVLDSPAPTALFLGFGDTALNFEVRFWAPRPEVVPELKSDVALRIAAALSETGINVVPQRALYITGLDHSAQGSVRYSSNEHGENQLPKETMNEIG
jgi:small-conductance mechanosensitive channel